MYHFAGIAYKILGNLSPSIRQNVFDRLLAENGVKVVLVGHKQLRSFRENLGLPDKDDFADALALALYYIQHQNSVERECGSATRSLRKFQKALGAAPMREDSGDRHSTQKAGSELCRTALWQWTFTRIEVRITRPKNEIGKQLAEIFDHEKSHKPIKLARSRTDAKAVQLLFKKLVEEICK